MNIWRRLDDFLAGWNCTVKGSFWRICGKSDWGRVCKFVSVKLMHASFLPSHLLLNLGGSIVVPLVLSDKASTLLENNLSRALW